MLSLAASLWAWPLASSAAATEHMVTERMTFEVNGLELSGLFDRPTIQNARALVIFVHGYGATNVVEQSWYYDLRARAAARGIASFVWDKPGCGESEGEFDIDQPVASSADEVVAAADFLRQINAPGAHKIGLWGISRAGWIAPLALARDKNLAFWISVSGVDDKETFGYLLASNWRVEGYADARIDRLLGQWRRGNEIVAAGGSYSDFIEATRDYQADPLVRYLSGSNAPPDETAFNDNRARWQDHPPSIDPQTGLVIYVDDFPERLRSLDIPVLALFGEKDTSVDWRATKALYESSIGQNPMASLSIKTFPNGNHNLHVSETGSFREMLDILNAPERVPGYYTTILDWLATEVTGR